MEDTFPTGLPTEVSDHHPSAPWGPERSGEAQRLPIRQFPDLQRRQARLCACTLTVLHLLQHDATPSKGASEGGHPRRNLHPLPLRWQPVQSYTAALPYQDNGATHHGTAVRWWLHTSRTHGSCSPKSCRPLFRSLKGVRAYHQPEEDRSVVPTSTPVKLHPSSHHYWRHDSEFGRTLHLPWQCDVKRRNYWQGPRQSALKGKQLLWQTLQESLEQSLTPTDNQNQSLQSRCHLHTHLWCRNLDTIQKTSETPWTLPSAVPTLHPEHQVAWLRVKWRCPWEGWTPQHWVHPSQTAAALGRARRKTPAFQKLKTSARIGKTKRHDIKFVKTVVCHESCFFSRLWMHFKSRKGTTLRIRTHVPTRSF